MLRKLISIFLIFFIQGILTLPENLIPSGSIIVSKDGTGDFTTIQAAIDSLTKDADSERVIYIKKGTYKEYVLCQKNHVTLVGEDRDSVVITYDLNNAKTGSSSKCATFRAYGNYFKAFDITFENTAPFPGTNTQAPAINCMGNYHYFENCNFLSYQDTLLSNKGKHYFKKCYIRGFTDFIWGFGRAVFDRCSLHLDSNGNVGRTSGYITASGNEDDSFVQGGFLITQCKVTTDGDYFYLGRLWRKSCYVIFDRCEFPGDKLVKEGWTTFSKTPEYAETAKVGEYQCFGPDYNTIGRVSYSTTFSSAPSTKEFMGGSLSFTTDSFYNKVQEANNDNQPKETTTKKVTTKTTKTSKTTKTKKPSKTKECVKLNAQCGGSGYKGPKCCETGKCKKISKYMSICQ